LQKMGNEPSHLSRSQRSRSSGNKKERNRLRSQSIGSDLSLDYESIEEMTAASDNDDGFPAFNLDECCATDAIAAGKKRGAEERGEQLARQLAKPSNPPGVTTVLHSRIAHEQWSGVKARLETHRSEASCPDEECRVPLSIACDRNAPEEIIRKLVMASPQSVGSPDKNGSFPIHFYCGSGATSYDGMKALIDFHSVALLTPNSMGNTPLQIAIERCAPNRILRLLIERCPDAAAIPNKLGSLPLHFCGKDQYLEGGVLKLLIKSYPEAVGKQNQYGATPLFLAIYWGASVHVLKELLSKWPFSVKVSDHKGVFPISSMWNLHVHRVKVDAENDEVEGRRVAENRKAMRDCKSRSDLVGSLGDWWEKMELLLTAAHHNSIENPLPGNRQFRVVHAAAAGDDCPPEVLRFALKIEGYQCRKKDEAGNLPLHIAALSPAYIKQSFETQHETTIDCK